MYVKFSARKEEEDEEVRDLDETGLVPAGNEADDTAICPLIGERDPHHRANATSSCYAALILLSSTSSRAAKEVGQRWQEQGRGMRSKKRKGQKNTDVFAVVCEMWRRAFHRLGL